jgi:hypothetical protein
LRELRKLGHEGFIFDRVQGILLSLAANASLAASAVVLRPAGALIFLLAVCAAAVKLLLVLKDIMVCSS